METKINECILLIHSVGRWNQFQLRNSYVVLMVKGKDVPVLNQLSIRKFHKNWNFKRPERKGSDMTEIVSEHEQKGVKEKRTELMVTWYERKLWNGNNRGAKP
jgi:hypothetical protein